MFRVCDKAGKTYDRSQITTVAVFGKPDSGLRCYAYSGRACAGLKGDGWAKKLISPTLGASWVTQQVNLSKTRCVGGINTDTEQEANCSSPEYDALTALVKETTDPFHREIEGSQVTCDVAGSPKCIDTRCYNYTGIADAGTFSLFRLVMNNVRSVGMYCSSQHSR